MTDAHLAGLAALCQQWQAVLSLRDWRITVVPANVYLLGKEERTAMIESEPCQKAATLSVLPADHPSAGQMIAPHDEEEAIVHELLHLLLAGLPRPENDTQEMLQEQALNAIASALVRLSRAVAPAGVGPLDRGCASPPRASASPGESSTTSVTRE